MKKNKRVMRRYFVQQTKINTEHKDPPKIIAFEMGTANSAVNWPTTISRGTKIPPPPIPPALDKAPPKNTTYFQLKMCELSKKKRQTSKR